MVLCLAVEVVIFRHLWRAWESLKRDDQSSVSIIVRVLAFTLVGMLSIMYVVRSASFWATDGISL
jgi:hypothetical protein